jgi:phosphoglucosamine mutase
VGFAFDGDGDRVMTVDSSGTVLDGDFVLALAARHFAKHGKLDPMVVIGTVMTNGGLEATLKRDGIGLVRTQVGDRYVWEELEKRKAQFGGEPSGHVIFREFTTTGDGILTALEVLTLMRSEHRSLAELSSEVERWPQITKNVKAPRRREWKDVARFSTAVRDAETELGTTGRLVVRPSGTEPVLRITVEARDPGMASRIAESLAAEAMEALA